MQEQNPNRFTVTIAWLTLWLAVAALGWFALDQRVKKQTEELQLSAETLKAAQQKHMDTVLAHEQTLRRSARDAAEGRRAELERALGGPLQAAFKNPEFSIGEALRLGALACVPTNANAHVDVDRFTEFTVTIASGENLTTNQMVQIARQFLPLAKPYLHELRFSVQGTVLAELDRADIDFIDDWSRAPNDRIAMLLARETASDSQQDAAAIDRFKQERGLSQAFAETPDLAPKAQAAQRKFMERLEKSFEDLNAALSLSQKAIALSETTKAADFDSLQRDFNAATARAKAAKQFWTNPTNQWSEILKSESITGEALDRLLPSVGLIFRNDPTLTAKVFEALDAKLETTRYFLKLATDRYNRSQIDLEKSKNDEESINRFRRAEDQLEQDSQSLERALRAWNEFLTR